MIKNEEVFYKVLKKLDEEKLLPYVIIIGSWSELLFEKILPDYDSQLKTMDIDFFYPNLKNPKNKSDLIKKFKEIGFIYEESPISKVGRFISEGERMEIEFLTNNTNEDTIDNKIVSLGIKPQQLSGLSILGTFNISIEYKGLLIKIPEPETYFLQKLLINEKRKNINKREKDIRSCKKLEKHLNKKRLFFILDNFNKEAQSRIKNTALLNSITIFK